MTITGAIAQDLNADETIEAPAYAVLAEAERRAAPYIVVELDPEGQSESGWAVDTFADVSVYAEEGALEQVAELERRVRERLDQHYREKSGLKADIMIGSGLYEKIRLTSSGIPDEALIGSLEYAGVRFKVYATKRL